MADFVRKLASVMVIDELLPIPKKDKIELARLDGWLSIVKKGEFKVQDKVVFIEPDSLLPGNPEFDFMLRYKYRVKQIRLGGQLSMGLLFRFQDLTSYNLKEAKFKVGDDLTDKLGIQHYQKIKEELAVASKVRKVGLKGWFQKQTIKCIEALIGPVNALAPWPSSIIKKTDEPQVRHVYNIISNKYLGVPAVVHEKIHGKSMTVFVHNDRSGVCSRNYELLSESTRKVSPLKKKVANRLAKFAGIKVVSQDQEDYWVYTKKHCLIDQLQFYFQATGKNIAIQVELCGPGINGNMYQFKEHKAFLFNVWDIDAKRYFNHQETDDFCQLTGIERVPFLAFINLHDDLERYIKDCSVDSTMGKCVMEGHVIRPLEEMKDPNIGRISMKVISPLYKNLEDGMLGIE